MDETDVDAMLRGKTKEELEAVLKLVGKMRDIAVQSMNQPQATLCADATCRCVCHG